MSDRNIASENITKEIENEIQKAILETEKSQNGISGTSEKLSINYVLEQIKKISEDTEYLYGAIEKLGQMANAAGPGDIVGAEKAKALGKIVESRESTNQQILRIYEKMYDDLMVSNSKNLPDSVLKFKQACEIVRANQSESMANDTIRLMAQQMFVVAGAEIVKLN